VNKKTVKTLVLGMGNPILGDDSAGIRVARVLEPKFKEPEITVTEASLAGLSLLELLTGFDKAIIIDAIQTEGGKAGQIYRIEPEAFDTTRRAITSHNVNFTTALELGRKVGLALPQEMVIFAIEVEKVTCFTEDCTPAVESAIPIVTDMVMSELAKS